MPVIDLPFTRDCDCSPRSLGCSSGSEWLKAQLSVWSFTYCSEDIAARRVHPCPFPLALTRRVVSLFTHVGELVMDPFCGSGMTALACWELGRSCLSSDLNPRYSKIARDALPPINIEHRHHAMQVVRRMEASEAASALPPRSVKLLWTSPPYANQLRRARKNASRRNRSTAASTGRVDQYSEDQRDLGNMEPASFAGRLADIMKASLPALAPGANVVLNIGDTYRDGRFEPLHCMVIERMRERGFDLRNVIIWDRRNLIQKTGIFGFPSNFITIGASFEYILHFRCAHGHAR